MAIVPVCMNKSKWVPVAILGILKSGAAFTLLDPAYPMERVRSNIEETRAAVMLSNVLGLASSLEESSIRDFQVPELCFVQIAEEQQAMTVRTNPRDCLCVVWTSGSTGRPTGAIVNHASYASAAVALRKFSGLTPESRVLHFTSYAFDPSVAETLGTLMAGGCICIPSGIKRDNRISAMIRERRVSFLLLTPTVARLLRPTNLASVSTLMLVGEAVTADDIHSSQGHYDIIIGYGPAECSATTTKHKSTQTADGNSIGVAIGIVCWVVNAADYNTLMPIGAVGGLLIDGPNVGRGYLNNTEKTKAAFIDTSNPNWHLRSARDSIRPYTRPAI